MEELDVPRRAEQVLALVKQSHKLDASPPSGRPKWPPDPSLN